MTSLPVIILAGGMSTRMGTDKAFLPLGQDSFLGEIVSEMLNLSRKIIITVGTKDVSAYGDFRRGDLVRILRDEEYVQSPLGGMLTGLNNVGEEYAAVLACDSPFIRADLIRCLFSQAAGFDAAVPIWDAEDKMTTEPLCAVYRVQSTRHAILRLLEDRTKRARCREMILSLPEVRFVPVSELRVFDRRLDSLRNINTRQDYETALAEVVGSSLGREAGAEPAYPILARAHAPRRNTSTSAPS